MQGPAKPLYGGSIPPLASNFCFMTTYGNLKFLLNFNIKKLVISFTCFVILVLCFVSYSYFRDVQRSEISANIAIGIANLEEGRNEIAIYYFQQAFNSSKGLYGVISGIGIMQSLQGRVDFKEKSQNIIQIIKDYNAPKFIQMIVLAGYLENSNTFKENDFKKFESYALKNTSFKQILESLTLNKTSN
jgi:hypothetical protein